MALPGRAQTFAYENCREMLSKLKREIDRYREVAGEKPQGETLLRYVNQLKDSAFNASVTAWHMADWVFNDLKPEQREALNLKNLPKLQARVRKVRALYLCNHVANASKHWSVEDKYRDPTIEAVVDCSEAGWAGYFLDGTTGELRRRAWKDAVICLPHDGVATNNITGKRYIDHWREAGFECETPIKNTGAGAAMMQVEAARRIFPRCWFNGATTEAGRDALGYYHEQRDENRNVGLGPEHDWSSHAARQPRQRARIFSWRLTRSIRSLVR